MIALGIDAPERSRVCVAFNDARGLLISADKARGDAMLFRTAADLIGKAQFGGATKANAERAIGALRALAGQFEMAADGRDPQAQ